MRLLHGARLDDNVVEMPIAPVVGEPFAAGPGAAQESQGFVEACRGFLNGNRKAGEFGRPVTLADAEIQPAIGEKIEGCYLLRQQHRIVPGQHHHGGAEPHALGSRGKVAQKVQRRGELSNTGEVMLDHEHAVKAEILGTEDVVNILAVPNAISSGPLASRLCPAKQTKLHTSTPLRAANPSSDTWKSYDRPCARSWPQPCKKFALQEKGCQRGGSMANRLGAPTAPGPGRPARPRRAGFAKVGSRLVPFSRPPPSLPASVPPLPPSGPRPAPPPRPAGGARGGPRRPGFAKGAPRLAPSPPPPPSLPASVPALPPLGPGPSSARVAFQRSAASDRRNGSSPASVLRRSGWPPARRSHGPHAEAAAKPTRTFHIR